MKIAPLILSLFICLNTYSQKVGLVFSGGGATGYAHIGVLKALEEHHIPIDFITGTSAGALVGAMYASGISPLQMEYIATSEQFYLMSQGELEKEYQYYLHHSDQTAEVFGFRFSKDSILQKSLPTNLVNATYMDLELLNLLGTNPLKSKSTFDSLFIPYRCVASDITTKQSVVFDKGDLNVAVRTSMTYPFFINPIEVNGTLLFDGGLYNNFPSDVMYQNFDVDYIIGSNVSYNEPPPVDDDLMSQVKNMFSSHSDYSLPCENGIIIEPQLGDIGTFDFDKVKDAIKIGYETTIAQINEIKKYVTRRSTPSELSEKRKKYLSAKIPVEVKNITTEGIGKDESYYIKRKLLKNKKNEVLEYPELKRRYLNLYQSENIASIFPTIKIDSNGTQTFNANIKKEKEFRLAFGGHFSSKPVNTGFIQLSYSDFKTTPLKIYANTYFGKFYGSAKLGLKLHLPTRNDSYIEPVFVMNRWDYFTSFTTFFEPVKPSFLVINQRFWGIKYNLPVFSKGKLKADFYNGINEYEYYQTEKFTNTDTADFTALRFYSPGLTYTRNALNRKQFESAGSFFEIQAKYVLGTENAMPGSTAIDDIVLDKTKRNWFQLKTTYRNYFFQKGLYRLGLHLEGYYAIKPFLGNYTSTILSAQQFNPFADASTNFFNDFRAYQYAAGGIINLFTINDKVDFRIEGYFFQPFSNIINNNGKAEYSNLFFKGFEMASSSVIYHSLIGPVRATVNYYGQQDRPFTFQLSYGFVIFNDRAIK